MNIWINGKGGFIGQHLFKRLQELGHYVECSVKDEIPFNSMDIAIHLAGTTTLSKDFIPELFHNNITYPELLFKQFKGKIIYASSTSAAELTNPYAYTKRYLEYIGEKHGNATGLRFFNVYGPGNNKGIVKRAIECALTGQPLKLSGGEQIRDFIYIDDVVNWICRHLDHEPGIVDIGTGCGHSIFHLIGMIQEITGIKIDVHLTAPDSGDMEYSVATPGIPNCKPLYEGLKKMICEY